MRALWRRLIVPLAVLAVGNAAVYAAYTLPRTVAERTLVARAATLRTEVEREQRLVAEEQRQERVLTRNAQDVAELYRRAGQKASILRVRDEVEKLAREIGFRLGARSYADEPVKGLPLTRFKFILPVSGNYGQLVAFLDRLERSQYFVTVDQVELRGSETGQSPLLNLTLSAYFFSGAEDHGAVAQ